MINYQTEEIIRGGIAEKIIRSEVWYKTPVGMFTTMREAVALAQELGCDPRLVIVPIPVFISENMTETKD